MAVFISRLDKLKTIKKTKVDMSEPHPDGIQESYEISNIDLRYMKNNDNDDYYFSITSKEITGNKKKYFKFIRFLYIKDAKHLKEMLSYIVNGKKYNLDPVYPNDSANEPTDYSSSIKTISKGIYQLNYSELIDARNSSFINLHNHVLDNNKRIK